VTLTQRDAYKPLSNMASLEVDQAEKHLAQKKQSLALVQQPSNHNRTQHLVNHDIGDSSECET
jgi:hypothetical protein